MTEHFTFFV